MATIHRYMVTTGGFQGSPGYSAFHFRYPSEPGSTPTIGTALHTLFDTYKSLMVAGLWTAQFSPTYQVLDETTGVLLDELSEATTPATVTGTGGNRQASTTGACLSLKTTTVHSGRKVRGRSFVVPLSDIAYDPDGTLTSIAIGILQGAGAALIADVSLAPWCVWARPVAGAGGVGAPITAVSVRDRAAVLRSRSK